MPAGFTPDGVPVGFEVLGRAWSEADLLSMAYAYEQAVNPRRPPVSVPPLGADGRPPAPKAVALVFSPAGVDVTGRAVWDASASHLRVEVRSSGAVSVSAVHRAAPDRPNGPVLLRLDPVAGGAAGTLTVAGDDRDALAAGRIYVEVTVGGQSRRAVINPGT